MLVLQNNAPARLQLSGLSASFEPVATASAKFDLSLSLDEQRASDGSPARDHGRVGVLDRPVRSRRASSVLAAVWRGCWRQDCGAGSADRRSRHSQPAGAPHRSWWSGTTPRAPLRRAMLPRPVRRAGGGTPMAIAVVCEEACSAMASSTAGQTSWPTTCAALGVGPEIIVGLCLERSPEMVVGLLGILKAGGAYLPLDPDYPAERLAFMMEDAGAAVLVTHSALVERLGTRQRVRGIDADWPAIESSPKPTPALPPIRNLAYVIYTSGSTGTPKGVVVIHNGVRLSRRPSEVRASEQTLYGPAVSFPCFRRFGWRNVVGRSCRAVAA